MGKNKRSKGPAQGVSNLNALLAQGANAVDVAPAPPEQKELTPEEVEAKVKKIMDVVSAEGETDMFLMQALLSECEEILRSDIQDAFYAGGD